jgi:hypothetical protein
MQNSPYKITNSYLLIALIASIPCIFFIFAFPEYGGDSRVYTLVAKNILYGCGVSISELGSDICVPHFGGNQGPGYPAFIALIWSLSGHSDLAVRLLQAIIYIMSIVYVVNSIHQYTSSLKKALIVGLVLAISPLHVAWPRFIFTETLALAGTLWVFGALILSFHNRKLRILPIGIGLICVTFIRLDSILLVIPVAITAFIIHKPLDAVKRGLIVGMILAVPWCGWLARNAHVGLENVFVPVAVSLNAKAPGMFSWVRVWSTNQYSSIGVHFPVYAGDYDKISVAEEAYSTPKEREIVTALLKDLQTYKNMPFPPHIDSKFSLLAQSRIKADPLEYFIIVPVKRIFNFWSNPNAGYGWPGFNDILTAQDRLEIMEAGVIAKLVLLKDYPAIVVGRIIVQSWKFLLYLGLILTLWLSFKNNIYTDRKLIYLALSFVLARSYLAGYLNLTEARFSVMQMPIIEIVVTLVLIDAFLKWKTSRVS